MRGAAVILAILAMGAMTGREATAAGREWRVSAGGGPEGGNDQRLVGWCAAVAALTPVRSWFLLGGEAAWHEFPSGTGSSEAGSFLEFRRSRAVTGTVTARLQLPITGVSPFVLAEAGAGGASLAEGRWSYGPGSPTHFTTPGAAFPFVAAGAGLGLRAVLPRPLPDVDATLRATLWSANRAVFEGTPGSASTETMGSLRLTLAW